MSNEEYPRNFMPKRKYWVLFPLFFIAAALALGWIVQFLWNAILPEVVGVKALTFPQALGLLALCRILFGGFRGGRPGPKRPPFGKSREHWMNMSEEERERFKASWQERCGKKE